MTLEWLLPRLALATLFVAIAGFAFFESIYLQDQSAYFSGVATRGSWRHIAEWMWAFRATAGVFLIFAAAIFLKR